MKSGCQVYYFGLNSSTSVLKRALSCRKMMSAIRLFNEIKRAFLFSRCLIPRTLSEIMLKFTFSLLLSTNSSHQNCTKKKQLENFTLHNMQNSSHTIPLRKLNQKLLTSSVQNIVIIIRNKNTKIEQNT